MRLQARVQRHTVEHLADICPSVQIPDALVPQIVDEMDAVRLLDRPISEQVIEVPMISCSPCPSRVRVVEPQVVEQLVEVPTVLSYSSLAEQI